MSLAGCLVLGCGGGVPLLHTVHTLAPGRTSFGVGVSDRLSLGENKRALDRARQRPTEASLAARNDDRGLLVALSESPALSPWLAARVGLAGNNEAGLGYTGDALRADARHAFEWRRSALSIGLGFTGNGLGHRAPDLPGVDLSDVKGVGADIPLLYGYRSDADLVSVWAGVRGTYEHWSGTVGFEPAAAERFDLGAERVAGGALLGVAVGLYPLWVAAEVELDYARVTGSLDGPSGHDEARADGVSVHPAGAVTAKF